MSENVSGRTPHWAPQCPRCYGRSERDPLAEVLDCNCKHCGFRHTSPLRRGVLVALSRSDCRCASCSDLRNSGELFITGAAIALELERRYAVEWAQLSCTCKRSPHTVSCPARVEVVQ